MVMRSRPCSWMPRRRWTPLRDVICTWSAETPEMRMPCGSWGLGERRRASGLTVVGGRAEPDLTGSPDHRFDGRTHRAAACGWEGPGGLVSAGSVNYYSTFISVADDCPVDVAQVPPSVAGRTTAAQVHLQLACDEAGSYTQEQILFRAYLNAKGLEPAEHPEGGQTWEAFFSKGQACLRTSPLAKRYGWGFYFDDAGRATAVAVESEQYARMVNDPQLRQLKAMRSSRR